MPEARIWIEEGGGYTLPQIIVANLAVAIEKDKNPETRSVSRESLDEATSFFRQNGIEATVEKLKELQGGGA